MAPSAVNLNRSLAIGCRLEPSSVPLSRFVFGAIRVGNAETVQ